MKNNTQTRSLGIFLMFLATGMAVGVLASPAEALYRHDQPTYSTRDRQRYNHAVTIYEEYLRQGMTELVEPSINDPETIEFYLLHPVAPDRTPESQDPLSIDDYQKPDTEAISTEALSDEERAVLSRSIKTGRCWHFEKFSAGFAELCRRLIQGREEVRTMGIESDLVELHRRVRQRSSSSR